MSWSGIKHNPEIVTVSFTGPSLNNTPDVYDGPAQSMETGAYVFDEHGCELSVFNISSDFSVDPSEHSFGPTAEHPDRDVFGWPEGVDQPVSIYNGVDEGWACPSLDAALEAALYEAAQKAAPDDDYGPGLSWFAVNETCDGPDGPKEVTRVTA